VGIGEIISRNNRDGKGEGEGEEIWGKGEAFTCFFCNCRVKRVNSCLYESRRTLVRMLVQVKSLNC